MTAGGVSSRRRWAVIPGVSTGVGAAVARAVARDPGLDVFGVHRGHYMDDAHALEADLRGLGRAAVLHVADAGTHEGVVRCCEELGKSAPAGSVVLFVHSLSGASIGHFLKDREDAFTPRQVEKTFNYLAHSFVYWAQELHARGLLAPRARLLGLTNALHDGTLHNLGLVAAAKEALQSYVRYLAVELGRHGHRVNLLKFGTVVTPALKTVMGPKALARMDEVHREMIPAGRMGTVEEVARLVSLLTSDEMEWFNGATIDYTGGMSLRWFDMILEPD